MPKSSPRSSVPREDHTAAESAARRAVRRPPGPSRRRAGPRGLRSVPRPCTPARQHRRPRGGYPRHRLRGARGAAARRPSAASVAKPPGTARLSVPITSVWLTDPVSGTPQHVRLVRQKPQGWCAIRCSRATGQPERVRGRLHLLPLLIAPQAAARARPHAPPVSEGAPPSRPHHFAA